MCIRDRPDATFQQHDTESETEPETLEFGSHRAETEEAHFMKDSPAVHMINNFLFEAARLGASDIHFEPFPSSTRVRFRIDGVLEPVSYTHLDVYKRQH